MFPFKPKLPKIIPPNVAAPSMTLGPGMSLDGPMMEFTPANVSRAPNCTGIYEFYDAFGRPLYVGRSTMLRHRLQSYYEQDDFGAHPTKKSLRSRIKFFRYKCMKNKKQISEVEREMKQDRPFNYL